MSDGYPTAEQEENIAAVEASPLVKGLRARITELERDHLEWMEGINNWRCPACKAVAGPLYPVNLCSELDKAVALIKEMAEALKKGEYPMTISEAGRFRGAAEECLAKHRDALRRMGVGV